MVCGARQLTQFMILLVLVAVAGSCVTSGARSTRLTDRDLIDAVQHMQSSLAKSDFFAQRSPNSAPAAIVINRVENLTSDVISRAEQWELVAQLRAALPIQRLAERKNITFLIAPRQHVILRQAGFLGDLGPTTPATHVMSATFRSTRRAGLSRADYYYLEYRITDRRTRQVVWTDSFEIKREVVGLVID